MLCSLESLSSPMKKSLPNIHPLEGRHTIKSRLGVKNWNYDTTKKFQDSWATKLPWAELCVRLDGSLHIVKCKICSEVERKNKLLFVKWDSLGKHASHRKVAKDLRTLQLGYQKRKKELKDFLELFFTNNIYMKQT